MKNSRDPLFTGCCSNNDNDYDVDDDDGDDIFTKGGTVFRAYCAIYFVDNTYIITILPVYRLKNVNVDFTRTVIH